MVLKIGIIDQKSELGLIPIKMSYDFKLANPSNTRLSADIISNIYNILDQTFSWTGEKKDSNLTAGAKCVLAVHDQHHFWCIGIGVCGDS